VSAGVQLSWTRKDDEQSNQARSPQCRHQLPDRPRHLVPAEIHRYTERPQLADMQVIVRHQDRGALRLDHLHDQALCEPERAR
jgi:hypothetical protein